MEDDSGDDTGPEEDDGEPRVLFTRQGKMETRAPWCSALIVKLFGRSLG